MSDQGHWEFALYLNNLWVLQDSAGKLLNLVRHGRREKHGLSLGWDRPNDLLDVRQESHVEHPIRLIEHQKFDAREVHGVPMNVIHESPWARDNNAWIRAELCYLVPMRNAPVNRDTSNPGSRSERFDRIIYLLSELSGGRQDERSSYAFLSSTQLLKEWKNESGGLPGACLS